MSHLVVTTELAKQQNTCGAAGALPSGLVVPNHPCQSGRGTVVARRVACGSHLEPKAELRALLLPEAAAARKGPLAADIVAHVVVQGAFP